MYPSRPRGKIGNIYIIYFCLFGVISQAAVAAGDLNPDLESCVNGKAL